MGSGLDTEMSTAENTEDEEERGAEEEDRHWRRR